MVFGRDEYEARLRNVRRRMEGADLDVLVIHDPANMNYLTGYDGWSFYVPQVVLVVSSEDQPVWIGRGQDANGAKVTSWLDEANIVGYPDNYVQARDCHAMDFVADVLKARGWDKGTMGLEMDAYYFSPLAYEALKAGLPDAHFEDANLLVNWVRAIKSPQEIALMRQAARIVERMMEVAVEAIAPGVRQCDAVAAIMQAQVSGIAEFGGDYAAIVPMLPTGKGTSAPHLTWSDSPFVDGEATILELAGVRHRYHCPAARTVHLGTPSQTLVDTVEAVVEGLNNALATVRPGVTCEAVEAAWRKTMEKYGIVKDTRIGYSTGLNYPPDWGEHTLSLRPGDRTMLRPSMTLHVIPALWTANWGIEISECVLVTETGAERLTNLEQALFVRS